MASLVFISLADSHSRNALHGGEVTMDDSSSHRPRDAVEVGDELIPGHDHESIVEAGGPGSCRGIEVAAPRVEEIHVPNAADLRDIDHAVRVIRHDARGHL